MAADPKEGEAAQALFCALADYVGSEASNKVLNTTTYKTMQDFEKAPKVHGGKSGKQLLQLAWNECKIPGISLGQIIKFLKKKGSGGKSSGWYESSVIIAKKIIQEIESIDKDFSKIKGPNFQDMIYVRGAKKDPKRQANTMEKIGGLFDLANSNDPSFGDVNKWSPADIYFVSDDGISRMQEEVVSLDQKLDKGGAKRSQNYNFKKLNSLCNGLLKAGDLLPLSLKKIVGPPYTTAEIHKYNFSRSAEEKNLAGYHYYGVNQNWSKPYTLTNKKSARDLAVYFSLDKKDKVKFRHDPSHGGHGVATSVKGEIEVTGAGGRGGSISSIPLLCKLLEEYGYNHLPKELLKEFKKGCQLYEQYLTGWTGGSITPGSGGKEKWKMGTKKSTKLVPKNAMATGPKGKQYISLNHKYFGDGEIGYEARKFPKTKLQDAKYKAYKEERAVLSAMYVVSPIFKILWEYLNDWASDDEKKRKRKVGGVNVPLIGNCSEFVQVMIAYTSSRSPKSGKFVIAK